MSRLEQAIKKARLSVSTTEDGTIILDRSLFPSRKSGKLCEVTLTEGVLLPFGNNSSSKELTAEAKFWKKKFETLKRDRNEEEEDLEHLIEVSAEREAKLIELARLLERKIDLMMTGGSSSSGDGKYAKLEMQRKLLRMYELMSALTIAESDKNDGEVLCTMKNKMRRLVTRFSFVMPPANEPDGEVLYTPLANAHLLPEWLRSQISCKKAMMPVIISEVMHELFAEEEEEQQEEEDE